MALWNVHNVSEAVHILYRLHSGALRETIEEHLGHLAPLDWGEGESLHLPWRWARRTGLEQAMLMEMRLGGGMPPATLHRPGRLWLGLALCLGLAAGALAGAALRRPAGPPVLLHGPGKPADTMEEIRQLPTGAWAVTVSTRKVSVSREVLPTARVSVRWENCPNGETVSEQGMVFVRICPGTFMMGSAPDDRRAYGNEKPAHAVTLSEYWIGRFEVTEEQYGHRASNLPVANVSWFDAEQFCNEHGWRLPTEAEWEYAARAVTSTAWSSGDDAKALADYAWFGEKVVDQLLPHPVGAKKPNPWGLYDMHGNVWEWVADWYGGYEAGSSRDPKGPDDGNYRVLRGGAFNFPSRGLRSAFRGWGLPGFRDGVIGFRCARDPRRQP